MDSKNTTTILFCAVFLLLGFILGRVTSHPRGHHGKHGRIECRGEGHGCKAHAEGYEMHGMTDMEVMVLADEDFDGDTLLTMPGKRIRITKDVRGGEEYVEVEVEAEQ